MLQKIGDILKTQRWLATVILGALALVFAVWGAYGIVDISFGAPSYGLQINGQDVSAQVINNAWQQQQSQTQRSLGGTPLSAAQKQQVQQSVIDSYVRQVALTQRAQQAGYRASVADVMAAYEHEPAFQVNGKFNADAAEAALAQAGLTPQAYEAERRQSIAVDQLADGIEESDFLTPTEISRIYALENAQRQLRYAVLPPARYAKQIRVDQADVEKWYHSHLDDYLTPESVKLQYAELTLAGVTSQVPVSTAALQAYYQKNKSRYSQPEMRHAHMILIAVSDPKNAKADAAALAKANRILAKLKAGAKFSALAHKDSDDPGSAAQGGDLGWADRSAYVKPFADALFSIPKVGQIVGPVKTQYGYHIIRLDGIRPAHLPTFQQALPQIRQAYQKAQASRLFGQREEQLQDALANNPNADIAMLASRLGMQLGEIDQFTRMGGEPLGGASALVHAVFSPDVLAGKRMGGPVQVGTNAIAVFRVQKHREPKAEPVSSVRDQVVASLRKSKAAALAKQAADRAVAELRHGTSFDLVAKRLRVKLAPAAFYGRSDPQLPAEIDAAAFASPRPRKGPLYQTVSLDNGGVAIMELIRVRPGTAGPNSQNDAQLLNRYLSQDRQADLAAYVLDLQQTAKVKRGPNLFQ